ncbi:M28 family metallopeptidase [Idiomarina abyssalis]|uniref:M28 family metallopeptidase n=1 Tax=Idiomarina abyssalis TaxID=86102 RepID=A0A8I1KDN6_9GAMM|nr:M28 family metallopeptidase [Idiomarina abyssalis]MBJ7265327.1 M28 family metallopeptidase [Idiomarina abyssalis]MBJ7274139.1 M28 family metallopeptidase [Idiomarina abyssalis]MBJ7315151.1 M28 family metallopeptidase [Idiomarina abyssalis]
MLKSWVNPLLAASIGLALPLTAMAQDGIDYKEQEKLHEIAGAMQADRIESDIQTLVDFGTRHTLSETESDTRGIGAARRWIFAEFERISEACGGCLEVMYVSDTISGETRIPDPVEVKSVIAIQRGKTDPNRYVMMSGDIDSRVSDVMDYTSDAPGANDNASGVAGALEAARVLTQYEFDGSIVYAALAGEEQGLFGGKILAEKAKEEGWHLTAVLNNDMIGNIEGINGVINNTTARIFAEGTRMNESDREATMRRFYGGEVDSPSRNLARYIDTVADRYINNLDTMIVYRLDRFGRGGHHRPFNDLGYAGIRIMETNENYNRQHQDLRVENGIEYGDTIEGVDFDYAAKLTALNAVSMASMSWAPRPPADVEIEGAVKPDTTLRWAPQEEDEENIAGYKVYWRLTSAPQWQFSRYVGNVNEYTLENVVIDNYIFGVASVSNDGFESPVVFPGPAGTFSIE